MREFQKEIIKKYKTKVNCDTCVDKIVFEFKKCKKITINNRCLLRTSFLNIKIKKVKRF